MGFSVEMGYEDVEKVVTIDVAKGDAHIRLGRAHLIVGDASDGGLFGEGSVVLVDQQPIHPTVVPNQHVRPAIPIDVRANHA